MRETEQMPGTDPARPMRVAAYIRVSTTNPEQEDSYELQERYFTKLLSENPTWDSVGVYTDYAISATNTSRRTGFRRLLRHCTEGRIDHIVSKSISRFARNTSDFLSAVRILKECGVTIYFHRIKPHPPRRHPTAHERALASQRKRAGLHTKEEEEGKKAGIT